MHGRMAQPREACLVAANVIARKHIRVARPSGPGRASDKMPLHPVSTFDDSANVERHSTRRPTMRGQRQLHGTRS